MRNSEFGIIISSQNYSKKHSSVGADPISVRFNTCISGKFSVGDGFPVPHCTNDFSVYEYFYQTLDADFL